MKDFLIIVFNWVLFGIIGYVSGWLMFLKPIIEIINCTNITGILVVSLVLKLLLAIPVAIYLYGIGVKIALKIFI